VIEVQRQLERSRTQSALVAGKSWKRR